MPATAMLRCIPQPGVHVNPSSSIKLLCDITNYSYEMHIGEYDRQHWKDFEN